MFTRESMSSPHGSAVPLYDRLRGAIRDGIERGDWKLLVVLISPTGSTSRTATSS
jgi:hypothetical protein